MGKQDASPLIACLDIGKAENIGWAILDGDTVITGDDDPQDVYHLDRFLEAIVERAPNRALAIGFEAPLFVPVRRERAQMTKRREGDFNRPWSFGAGLLTLAYCIPIMVEVFDHLEAEAKVTPTLDWQAWDREPETLLVWEAFVSGSSKPDIPGHHNDALVAAQAFRAALGDLEGANAVTVGEGEAFSTVGAALIYSGLAQPSQEMLSSPCLVIKP